MMTTVAMPAAGGLTRGGRTGRVTGRRLGKGNYKGDYKHRRLRLVRASASNPEEFIVGCGTGDVTGPIDGVGMMGYAKIGQVTRGMWQRQWARAFLVSSSSDSLDSSETVAVVVTAFGTTDSAISAMKEGAYDYLTKPFKVDELRIVIEKALEKKLLSNENQRLRRELESQSRDRNILGSSRVMQEVFELIAQVAETKTNVLVSGESGTGKELVARAIHEQSNRASEPFIATG